MDSFTGERCGIENCRSREYHYENGLLFCRRGHQQEGHVQHEQEFEDLNPGASQTYRVRDRRREEEEQREIRSLAGPRGLKLYRVAYEHVLRSQLRALIERKGFSQQLEQVGQELWALRVQIALDEGCDLDEDAPRTPRVKLKVGSDGEAEITATDTDGEGTGSSEDDDDSNGRNPMPNFLESFAICYLAALILRIPLPVSKLHQWMVGDVLPYIKALKNIPRRLSRNFEPWMSNAFSPERLPQQDTLHLTIAGLVIRLLTRFPSMTLPPVNVPLLRLDYCTRLGMPISVRVAAQVMMDLTGANKLTFPKPEAGRHLPKAYLPLCPEVQLVAWIVVAAKLYIPFNRAYSKKIYAFNVVDPALLNMSWTKWSFEMQDLDEELDEEGPLFKPGDEARTTPGDVYGLSEEKMDAYMDWFEDKYMDEDDEGDFRPGRGELRHPEGLLKMFPYGDRDNSKERKPLKDPQKLEAECYERLMNRIHRNLVFRETFDPKAEVDKINPKKIDNPPRVGSRYATYNRKEDLRKHDVSLEFHTRAAAMAMVDIPTLLAAVKIVEMNLKAGGPQLKAFTDRRMREEEEKMAKKNQYHAARVRKYGLDKLPIEAFEMPQSQRTVSLDSSSSSSDTDDSDSSDADDID